MKPEQMLSLHPKFFSLVISLLLAQATFGQEWARFRGPNGEGISPATTIPVRWTENDYRWRVTLPGIGYSSPVVCGSRVFITSAREENALQIVCCLSTADGKTLWQQTFDSAVHKHHPFNCFASSTPALDADSLYFLWANPEQLTVVKLSQATGEEQWRRDLGPFVADHAIGASPIVYQDMVIVPNEQDGESSIVALDRKTGEIRWQANRRTEKTAYATPCVYTPKGRPVAVCLSTVGGTASAASIHKRASSCGSCRSSDTAWSAHPLSARGSCLEVPAAVAWAARCLPFDRVPQARTSRPKIVYELKGSLPYVVTPVGLRRVGVHLVRQGSRHVSRSGHRRDCLERTDRGRLFWIPCLRERKPLLHLSRGRDGCPCSVA